MVEQGYAFDLELLVLARRHGFEDFVEAPVRILRRFRRTVSPRVVIEMLQRHLRHLVAAPRAARLRARDLAAPGRPGPRPT